MPSPSDHPANTTHSVHIPSDTQQGDEAEKMLLIASAALPHVVSVFEDAFGPCGVIICVSRASGQHETISVGNITDPKLQAQILQTMARRLKKITPQQIANQSVSDKGWGPSSE